jgi:hypothetical protein
MLNGPVGDDNDTQWQTEVNTFFHKLFALTKMCDF